MYELSKVTFCAMERYGSPAYGKMFGHGVRQKHQLVDLFCIGSDRLYARDAEGSEGMSILGHDRRADIATQMGLARHEGIIRKARILPGVRKN